MIELQIQSHTQLLDKTMEACERNRTVVKRDCFDFEGYEGPWRWEGEGRRENKQRPVV